jgi:protein-tyrosine-phosphatase
MAAALLGAQLDARGVHWDVQSAGFVSAGVPAPANVIKVMGTMGFDLSSHRSQAVDRSLVESSDLVVTMSRQHLVDLAIDGDFTWHQCFTFGDLLRRANRVGGRASEESVPAWVARLDGGRRRASILGQPLSDDIPDPMGGRLSAFVATRDQLAAMTVELAKLLVPA